METPKLIHAAEARNRANAIGSEHIEKLKKECVNVIEAAIKRGDTQAEITNVSFPESTFDEVEKMLNYAGYKIERLKVQHRGWKALRIRW